ncbi:MAG TPA: Gfo/Idh/MocA family oxidoreductase [Candidatus Sulfotelmatobacter sp.]|jgi:predicted dehydrogenase|nr:Gfo/Idh/MocA family oxidoreductase [Candidatus Sulfotelmatobacter sp.]
MKLSRREFNRLLALGTAAHYIPNLHAQTSPRKTGYCIVGLGRISMQHFMPAIKSSPKARVTALVSGHRDKAERMAAEYGVPASSIYSYDNYDAIAANPNIDAVYIALPNSMHAEYSIRAAKAGKHVLCEKPMSTTVADARDMIAACQQAKTKLMIGYRCHLEPVNLRAVQLIREGRLGQIQAIESTFGFNIGPNEWRTNRKLAGGGPLMDVGIYSLNACRYLTSEEPVEIDAHSSVIDHDGRFAEVEENISWTMTFPSGVLASCNSTYGANMPGFYRVHGSRGVLNLDNAFVYEGLALRADIDGAAPITMSSPSPDPAHFAAEAEHFADCIQQDKQNKAPGEEGLRDMELMMRIYDSCKRHAA